MEDATRRYMPIVVEFDPDFMLVSMEMWRKSLDPGRFRADNRRLTLQVTRNSCQNVVAVVRKQTEVRPSIGS
ncbi:hypothetical protein CA602_13305 [Paraburkholderia hospita]|nr:hypothetical protein CA602_13305 [Paraburkholderia hospita]